jgi:hypothetical protein
MREAAHTLQFTHGGPRAVASLSPVALEGHEVRAVELEVLLHHEHLQSGSVGVDGWVGGWVSGWWFLDQHLVLNPLVG